MTLERVAAELEIRDVLARLAQYADSGDPDDYVALFSDDAIWDMPDNDRIGLRGSRRQGRNDIRAGVHERRAAGVQGPGSDTLHAVMTTSIDFDGPDTAHAHSYFQFYASTASAPTLQNMGQYRDTFRRTPDGWKLAHRVITFG